MNGFGLKGIQGDTPLRLAAEMTVDSDANKIAACPSKASIIAVKGSCGHVWLFDFKMPEKPVTTLGENQGIEGFALEWNQFQKDLLATGGNDGWLHIWDVSASSSKPLWSTLAHSGALNDLSYSPEGHQAVSAGEDNVVAIWDLRSKAKSLGLQANVEPLSVDWNHHDPHLLLTGGKDQLLQIWDTRNVKSPVKSLKGHGGEVVQVRWCPAGDEDVGGVARKHLLASASSDSKVILWNLDSTAGEADDDQEPEVLFIHSGHHGAVNDFGWGLLDDLLFCSVGEDHLLELWQPAASLMEEDKDDVAEAPAKRPRTETQTA